MNNKGLGICEWSLPIPLRGPMCCRVAHDFGLQAVELELGITEENYALDNPYVIDLYKEERAKYDITFTGVAVNLTDFFPMVAPLGDPGREQVEFALRKGVDAAAALDIPLIHVPSLCIFDLLSGVKDEEGMKNTSECLQRTCDYAADKGVIVCSENDFSTEMQLEQIEQVNRDNFKIYFDTQNYYVNGRYTPGLIEPIFDHIAEFHVKDGYKEYISSHLVGEGGCDAFKSLEEFDRLGYTGWVILENYYARPPLCGPDDDPYELLKKDIAIVKGWLDAHK